MKTTFKGKERQIIPIHQPIPKINQVWEHVQSKELYVVYDLNKVGKETVSAFLEDKEGSRYSLGCNWFNGKDYRIVGHIF